MKMKMGLDLVFLINLRNVVINSAVNMSFSNPCFLSGLIRLRKNVIMAGNRNSILHKHKDKVFLNSSDTKKALASI